jgi:chemotaxis protein CheX
MIEHPDSKTSIVKQVPKERLITYVSSSMEQVFSTMLSVEIAPGAARVEGMDFGSFDGVMALVGIAGSWTGTGRLMCSPTLARALAGSFLMSTFDSVDEEVLDAMAEIANMVVGNFKNMLEEELGPLLLSVPTVIFGKNYKTRSVGLPDWMVIPFNCLGETMEFRFCLLPTPTNPHAGFKLELNHV